MPVGFFSHASINEQDNLSKVKIEQVLQALLHWQFANTKGNMMLQGVLSY